MLDALSAANLNQVLSAMALKALEVYAIPPPWLPQDTATIALYGAYEDEPQAEGLPNNFPHRKPRMPAVNEASKIAIFEALIISKLPTNARFVIKIYIMKPMPPRSPAPKICPQCRSSGSRHMPTATATTLNSVIPTGLPITRPPMMPTLFALVRLCAQSVPMTIPVFAKAKIGRMTNATGLCNTCSSRCEGEAASSSWAENGIANASNTPAIVACTPDCNSKNHMHTPPSTYGTSDMTLKA